eukprot:TRINITY_DN37259_c0_g1_i1.p1 TRINITY_DN37259_c0_g1~~TRINITY_DN37259_c0_g1_i1.p1  ORF type:complete len:372 (+),score=66.17 TRINITY_DN37259_c0_g1_i1:47-1117(+)
MRTAGAVRACGTASRFASATRCQLRCSSEERAGASWRNTVGSGVQPPRLLVLTGSGLDYGSCVARTASDGFRRKMWATVVDSNTRYRWLCSVIAERGPTKTTNNVWLESGMRLDILHLTGEPLVLSGLSVDDGATVVDGWEVGLGMFSYGYIAMRSRHSQGTSFVNFMTLRLGFSIGWKSYRAGMFAPIGVERRPEHRMLSRLTLIELLLRIGGTVIGGIVAVLFGLLFRGWYQHTQAMDGADEEFRSDLELLISKLRKEQMRGNTAAAAHLQHLILQMYNLREGSEALGINDEGIAESAKNLPDIDTDRFRVWGRFTSPTPLYGDDPEPELSPADAMAKMIRERKERRLRAENNE